MKFIRLEIKNIASIEKATIPFNEGPLHDEALFLISGKTGSGKSTLLDAICLALYGNAPRLQNLGNEKYQDKKLNVSGNDGSVTLKDTRQLVRRDTGEAYVILSFIGNNEKHYEAQWYASRGKKLKIDAQLSSVARSLYCKEENNTITKEVDKEIEKIEVVGLNFEQFCRTTLLAQGEFTKFLDSKETEKADILEKLTGTDQYSLIGTQIYLTYKEKENNCNDQKKRIEALQLLSFEQKAEIEAQISQIQEANNHRNELIKTAEIQSDWLHRYQEKCKKREKTKANYETIEQIIQSESFLSQQKLVQNWELTTEARNCFNELKILSQERDALENKKQEIIQSYTLLMAGYGYEEKKRDSNNQQIQSISAYLEKEQERVLLYNNIQSVCSNLKQLKLYKIAILENQRERKIAEDKLPILKGIVEEKQKILDHINQQINEQQSIIAKTKMLLQEKEVDTLKLRESELKQEKQLLSDAQAAIRQLNEIQKTYDTTQKQSIQLNSDIHSLNGKIPQIKEAWEQSKREQKKAEERYQSVYLQMDNHAKSLRSRLHIGDTCPVCGETIQVLHSDEEIQQCLNPLKKEWEQWQTETENNQEVFHAHQAQIQAKEEVKRSIEMELQTQLQTLQKARSEATNACNALSFFSLNENTLSLIENKIAINQQTSETINHQLNDAERLQNKILSLMNQENKFREQQSYAQANINQAEKEVTCCENSIQSQSALLRQSTEKAEDLRQVLKAVIPFPHWEDNIDENLILLQNEADKYEQNKKKQEKLILENNQITASLDRISDIRKQVEASFPLWDWKQPITVCEKAQLESAWTTLLTTITALHTTLMRNKQKKEEMEKILNDFLHLHSDISDSTLTQLCQRTSEEINQIHTYLTRTFTEKDSCLRIIQESELEITQLEKEKPELSESDSIEHLNQQIQLFQEEKEKEAQKLGALLQQITDNAAKEDKVKELQKQIQVKENDLAYWYTLDNLYGTANGAKFRKIAQSYILNQLLENTNYYLKQFTERYELIRQSGSLIILIIDKEQDGIPRPTNTLSGGESFIVSLSLALGLSSLNQNTFAPDILFIDEGFGTLSEDYLNTVIETLETLHQIGNRKVGIISHVEQLQERIHTQIQVTKSDYNRSIVTVVS